MTTQNAPDSTVEEAYAAPVVITQRKTCRAEYREVVSAVTVIENYGTGVEQVMLPTYGRVIKESKPLPRSAWKKGVSVADFVESVLGPPPKIEAQ